MGGKEYRIISPEFVAPGDIQRRPWVQTPETAPALPEARIPLSSIPFERRNIPPGLRNTAGHELNHVLIAQAYNIPLESISVKPEGNVLGKTTFAGFIEPETFKIIAAAGSINLPDGQASGFGMDMYMIDMLHYSRGGNSKESAKAQAGAILAGFNPYVRVKAAEIIAYLGRINGSLLGEVLERAEFEVGLNSREGKKISGNTVYLNNHERSTIIEYLEDKSCRVTYIEKGAKVKEFVYCGLCLGVDGHKADCLTQREENEDLIKQAR